MCRPARLSPARRLIRRPDVIWRSLPGFLVLVRLDGDVIVAEGSAGAIWARLADEVTVEELVHGLAQEFAVEPDSIAPSVNAFVGDLAAKDLLRTV